MSVVLVERAFESAEDLGELQRKEATAAFCFATRRVKPLRSFFALDRLRMITFYEAPDTEAVRETQRTAQLPVEHAWSAIAVVDRELERPAGFSLVVAQRALPPEVTLEHVQYLATDPTGCGKRLRLHHIAAFLARDLRRMCCAYYAPDLESVRVANRETGTPIERLWAAELIRSL